MLVVDCWFVWGCAVYLCVWGVGYLLFVWCEVAWFGGFSGVVGFGSLDGFGVG